MFTHHYTDHPPMQLQCYNHRAITHVFLMCAHPFQFHKNSGHLVFLMDEYKILMPLQFSKITFPLTCYVLD